MPQDLTSTSTTNTFTTGYTTGTICPRTGSYKAKNNYMEAIVVVIKGAKFPNFIDGKKTTWYALSSGGTTTTSDGGFASVTAPAGAA